MFLFESLLKIERKPNKLYLITKYSIKSAWSKAYNQKKDQLQQERKALFAEDPTLQKKDMWYRILFFMYCIPVFVLTIGILSALYEYVPEGGTKAILMIVFILLGVTLLSILHILDYALYHKGRDKSYDEFSRHHGRFDMNLLHIKTVLVYLLEIIKTFAGYFAFIFIIRLVWCIILFETGLDAFFTPKTSLGLDDLYLYVAVVLTSLFAIVVISRTLKKSVVTSWEKLNTILDRLESPTPAIATFIA